MEVFCIVSGRYHLEGKPLYKINGSESGRVTYSKEIKRNENANDAMKITLIDFFARVLSFDLEILWFMKETPLKA
jgi:hypothetical protein